MGNNIRIYNWYTKWGIMHNQIVGLGFFLISVETTGFLLTAFYRICLTFFKHHLFSVYRWLESLLFLNLSKLLFGKEKHQLFSPGLESISSEITLLTNLSVKHSNSRLNTNLRGFGAPSFWAGFSSPACTTRHENPKQGVVLLLSVDV